MIAYATEKETSEATLATLGLGEALASHKGDKEVLGEILGVGFGAPGSSEKGMHGAPVVAAELIKGVTAFGSG